MGLKEPLWREIWSLLSCKVQDNPNNKNNRFQVAADLNHKLSGGPFPFWNCPPSQASEFLTTKKSKSHADVDIPEFRNAEEHGPGAQPVWKLFTAGSVGSQTILGIPVLNALRFDDGLKEISQVWPFETGLEKLKPPKNNEWMIMHAEIFPSIFKIQEIPGQIKDLTQIETVARKFAFWDEKGTLGSIFAGPTGLSKEQRKAIETEEGWILGLT